MVTALHALGQEELLVRDDHRQIATFTDVNPRQLRAVFNGKLLVEAMELNEAEEEDWNALFDSLRRVGTVDAKGKSTDLHAVVPRGKPADVTRVEIAHRVVDWGVPKTLGVEDLEPDAGPS